MTATIENMKSSNGNPIPNQFIIRTENATIFQSYNTTIAKIDKYGTVYLDAEKWNYSPTTAKYRNQFLAETTKETQKKIDSGEYQLWNLN